MPRRKSGIKPLANFDAQRIFSSPRSYVSLLYGALTVIVVFVVLFFGLRAISHKPGTVGENGLQTSGGTQKTYTVKKGDSLWSIALATYNDGYKWTEIAKTNKLTNPDQIEIGMKLVVPVITPAITPTPTVVQVQPRPITGSSYTVDKGDNLWNIAVRAYGDGYKWVDIAKANKLANPDLIHSGNVFKLPR